MGRVFAVVVLAAVGAAFLLVNAGEEERRFKRALSHTKELLRKQVGREALDEAELAEVLCGRLALRLGRDGVDRLERTMAALRKLRGLLREYLGRRYPFWRPLEVSGPRIPLKHRTFNIGDILKRPPDVNLPSASLIGDIVAGSAYLNPEKSNDSIWDDALILTCEETSAALGEIANAIFGWHEENKWTIQEDEMVVVADEESLKRFEEALTTLRLLLLRTIRIDYRLYTVDHTLLERLLQGGPAIGKEKLHLLQQALKANKAKFLAQGHLLARDGQRVARFVGTQHTYISDYDINTTGMPVLQPVMRVFNEGFICCFKPYILSDETILLQLRFSQSRLDEKPRIGKHDKGEYEKPSATIEMIQTVLRLPQKEWFLVGGTAVAEGQGFSAVMIVRCRLQETR